MWRCTGVGNHNACSVKRWRTGSGIWLWNTRPTPQLPLGEAPPPKVLTSGDQVLKYMSLWETFHVQTTSAISPTSEDSKKLEKAFRLHSEVASTPSIPAVKMRCFWLERILERNERISSSRRALTEDTSCALGNPNPRLHNVTRVTGHREVWTLSCFFRTLLASAVPCFPVLWLEAQGSERNQNNFLLPALQLHVRSWHLQNLQALTQMTTFLSTF